MVPISNDFGPVGRRPESEAGRAANLAAALGAVPPCRVAAFAGSGGKSSLILRLARELHEAGVRVAVTSTTRMRHSEILPAGFHIVSPEAGELVWQMGRAFKSGLIPFLFAGSAGPGKLLGLAPDTVDGLRDAAEALLVEADGSRGIPLKVPRPFEPVVPSSCDLFVVVLGASALGKQAGDETVFNLEGAAGAVKEGDVLDPAAVARLVHLPGGFLRFRAPGRRVVLAVNQADAAAPDQVEELALALGHGAVDRVVCGSASRPGEGFGIFENRAHTVAAIVLAAGESRRFGSNKMLAAPFGVPMVVAVARAAAGSGADRTIVVTGRDAESVSAAAATVPGVACVCNPDFAQGMSASVRAGLDAAGDADAAMVMLGDMPFITSELAGRTVAEYRSCTAPLCHPVVDGRPGHPVIFRRDLWGELRALRGDQGGRPVAARHGSRARTFEWLEAGSQEDVDEPGPCVP